MTGAAGISAAVAACDRPDGVRRCLLGILEGERLPDEVIVVDQSRDDAVQAVISGLHSPVPIRRVAMPRRGLSASRNAALAQSHQPVIAFTDDDCVPDRAWIATAVRVLGAHPGLAGITGRVLALGEERPGTFAVSLRTSEDAREFTGRVVPWTVGTGGNFAARREWLQRVGGFDERLGAGTPGRAAEDADLLYRLLRAGGTLRYEPAAVVYHERQSADRRLSSRQGYGHGIGALCALYLRRGDPYALRMLGGYLAEQSRSLVRSVGRRDWFAARQRLFALQGCAGGVVYGLRVP